MPATTCTIQTSVSGDYRVLVANQQCAADTSAAFSFMAVSINSPSQRLNLSIRPNPAPAARWMMKVTLPGGSGQLTLHDALGRVRWQRTVEPGKRAVQGPPDLAAGIYWMHLTQGTQRLVRKVWLR